MKKTLLVIFLHFVIFTYAQVNFEKGYFIDNKGNRMECFIKNTDWKNNPVDFVYKLHLEDTELKTATIENTMEFGIENVSKYKRFKIKIERSSDISQKLQKDRTPIWKEEVLFLKSLVEGKANLYVYNDVNLVKFFFETDEKPIEQLVRIRYLINEGNDISQYNPFRQQIYNYVHCDKTSHSDIENLKYEYNEFVAHFIAYNNCFTNKIVDYDAIVKRKSIALKFTPSVFNTALSIRSPYEQYNASVKIDKITFKFGVEVEYILPFNKGQWSIFTNPSYHTFKTTEKYVKNDGISNDGNDVHHITTVDYNVIELPLGVRYNFFINPNSKLFLNFAFAFNLVNDSNINFENLENQYSGQRDFKIEGSNHTMLGIGYSYKKLSAELRVNNESDLLSNYGEWSAKYKSIGLVFGYDFL